MTKPRKGFMPPGLPGQTKLLIVNEGNPTALLMTTKAGRRNVGSVKMRTPEIALDWCRKNSVMMVYCPVRLEGN